jgi:hypothetical protein
MDLKDTMTGHAIAREPGEIAVVMPRRRERGFSFLDFPGPNLQHPLAW